MWLNILLKATNISNAKSRKCVCLPERPTGVPMNFGYVMSYERYKWSYSAKLPRFGLDGIVHVAEVLQVGRGIGLDHIVGVIEKLYDLVEVRISPMNTRYAYKEEMG